MPSSAKPPPRQLHSSHFAFMRALVQGLDERASWERYLRLEGEHSDVRNVRRTIAWIRDAFAAAARREQRPGTLRLILLDQKRLALASVSSPQPTLAAFAQAQGLEDFSEAEQLEAYLASYPQDAYNHRQRTAAQRRARLIYKQLQALHWLQQLAAQDPQPGDSVFSWLKPSLAERLERAGVPTLFALVERINGLGARWWAPIPGLGERKAARILQWLDAHAQVLSLHVGRHAEQPRRQLTPAMLAAVVPAATALRPYEKFLLPAALDGRAGQFRAPPSQCLLAAANDHEAIGAWLASKRPAHAAGQLSPTQRAYRKEAERLLLWSILERRKALSSLNVEDAYAYRSFLAQPPPAWCGPRHHQRWSPLWRPLEGPLSAMALRQALIIVRSLFAFFMGQNYLVGNPFAAVALPGPPQRPLGSSRTLSFAQWDHIEALLQQRQDSEPGRRLARAMRWIYATGLRLSEITRVRCQDLEPVEYRDADGALAHDWLLTVVGKGERSRQVPVPSQLVHELGEELARHGRTRDVQALDNQALPVLARFAPGTGPLPTWSSSGLYQAIKAFMAVAADSLEGPAARQLRQASTHWLRHSHGSHALQGRAGQAPVPLQVVQNNLGHASLGTTSLYLTTERDERLKAMRGFWNARGNSGIPD